MSNDEICWIEVVLAVRLHKQIIYKLQHHENVESLQEVGDLYLPNFVHDLICQFHFGIESSHYGIPMINYYLQSWKVDFSQEKLIDLVVN